MSLNSHLKSLKTIHLKNSPYLFLNLQIQEKENKEILKKPQMLPVHHSNNNFILKLKPHIFKGAKNEIDISIF